MKKRSYGEELSESGRFGDRDLGKCHLYWHEEMPLNEAVELAITECIREGILAEFLQHNRAEVYKVSIFEYDKEKEEKKLRKAERECGREEGRKEGREETLELISRMSTGGDAVKIPQLRDPKILEEMKKKYGME